ncbi:hypothetical protein N657DRAFT_231761 [Parathielavia appendiculata]|uniref:Uncharacterized protein n=1 Tax=Parathielavia appendiculata TaxID=2587402 RepID=A0AAN6Z7V5_9PEZI|nr:hypothetical protein N657DRAFT_231761 [Parathielavia appendiculata]
MPPKNRTPSAKSSMSSRAWTCCKCSNLNSGGHHVRDGVSPYSDGYGETCDHRRCPICYVKGDDDFTHDLDGNIPPTPLPLTGGYYYSPTTPNPRPSAKPCHGPDVHLIPPPPQHEDNPFSPFQRCYPDYCPSHTSFSTRNNNTRFPYTTTYLQSAAQRGNTITFAEAFHLPSRLSSVADTCPDQLLALANLRLDYSAGGSGRSDSVACDNDDEHEHDDDDMMVTRTPHGHEHHQEGEKPRMRATHHRHGLRQDEMGRGEGSRMVGEGGGNGWCGEGSREARKRKAERERGRVEENGNKRRDMGNGKERQIGSERWNEVTATVGCAWTTSRRPVEYQPTRVEDGSDEEGMGLSYGPRPFGWRCNGREVKRAC